MTKGDIKFDLTKNDDWFDIRLLIDCKQVCGIKQFIQGETYLNAMKLVFNKLKIFSTQFVHFGLGIGPILIELKQIKNLGNWKPETQDKFYWDNIPIKIMKVMIGASENHRVHYNPRNVPKPPEELQRLFFFI